MAANPLLNQNETDELAKFADDADKEIRSDLIGGYIRNEDDYTSNFTGSLRRKINAFSRSGLTAVSYMVPTPVERALGIDAAIVIRKRDKFKIGLFEAKWPRISRKNYRWDRWQDPRQRSISHFSHQLVSQAIVSHGVAVFEMFYCEDTSTTPPFNFLPGGSSCIWHQDAAGFQRVHLNPPTIWRHSHLGDMFNLTPPQTIGMIVRSICECSHGHLFDMGTDASIKDVFPLEGELEFVRNVLLIEAGNESTE